MRQASSMESSTLVSTRVGSDRVEGGLADSEGGVEGDLVRRRRRRRRISGWLAKLVTAAGLTDDDERARGLALVGDDGSDHKLTMNVLHYFRDRNANVPLRGLHVLLGLPASLCWRRVGRAAFVQPALGLMSSLPPVLHLRPRCDMSRPRPRDLHNCTQSHPS